MDENEIIGYEETTEQTSENENLREVTQPAAIGILILAGIGVATVIGGGIKLVKNKIIPAVKAAVAAYKEKTNEKESEPEEPKPEEEEEPKEEPKKKK